MEGSARKEVKRGNARKEGKSESGGKRVKEGKDKKCSKENFTLKKRSNKEIITIRETRK